MKSMTARRWGLPDAWPARAAVWVCVLVFGAVLATVVASSKTEMALVLGSMSVFLVWEATQDRWGRWGIVPGLAVYCVGISQDWAFITALGLAVVALVLPARIALLAVTLGMVGATWHLSTKFPPAMWVVAAVSYVAYVLLVYLLERVASTARDLRTSREALATLEVDVERTRLAEELNTVIGNTLHQVGRQVADLRADLPQSDPTLVEQLRDVAELVEHGLSQLDLLSFEPLLGDFDDEMITAQSLCKRLGVELITSVDDVSHRADKVFALITRESITNMFKHAVPTRCTIAARNDEGLALLIITNDGLTDSPGARSTMKVTTGSGHRRWRAELNELGGSLQTQELTGGRFRVVASVPLDPTPTAQALVGLKENSHG